MYATKVCAVIPAHNEEKGIEAAVMDLIDQTFELDTIVVVDDLSTDNTAKIVTQLSTRYPKRVILVQTTEPRLRAGAINEGLRYIRENVKECDFVLSTDADNRFDKTLVHEGVKSLERDPRIGGVCSIAGVLKPTFNQKDGLFANIRKWLLWRLQRLEYAGFDATRTATWHNVLILHGLCSMFRFEAITQAGGYQANHLLEDYKLTLKLKKGGWNTIFNPRMVASTRVPETIKALIRQRLRWMRGGVQIILEEGINKYTIEDAFNHLIFITMLVLILANTILWSQHGWHISLNHNPLPVTLAILAYLFSVYNLRYVRERDAVDVILRILIVPELLLAMIHSGLQVWAYLMTVLKTKQTW